MTHNQLRNLRGRLMSANTAAKGGLRMEPNTGDNAGAVGTLGARINPDMTRLKVVPTTLAVYRNLRIGLGLTAVMLSASILIQSIHVHAHVPADRICFQSQLSEYFYTTAHSIFIGSLLILAALFFVYRSTTDTENALLQLAGVAALTAALVPEEKRYLKPCKPIYIPDQVDVSTVIRINLVAVVVALVAAWVITMFQHKYKRKDAAGKLIYQRKSSGGNKARCVLRTVVVLGLVAICIPKAPLQLAHGVAGLLLLLSFIATAFATAFIACRERRPPKRKACVHCFYKCFYLGWAMFMALTLVGIFLVLVFHQEIMGDVGGTILETAITLQFCVYWAVQTFDLWDEPDRRRRLSVADRQRLAGTYVSTEETITEDNKPGAQIMSFL
jgi:hypothetical protein